jgi:MscS family membrane protein
LHTIGLRYETSPEQFEWLLEELRRLVAAHPMVEKSPGLPRIVLTGFGDSSVNMQILAYVLTTDFGEFVKIQERLILDIISAVEAAGTGFAFPSQTAYLARDEGLDATKKRRIEEEMQFRRFGPEAHSDTAVGSATDEDSVRAEGGKGLKGSSGSL